MRDLRIPYLLCLGLTLSSFTNSVQATAISGQGTWETTLEARDLDGSLFTVEAYYDTVLDITWLRDRTYGAPYSWGWEGASGSVASLDPYGSGITGWRLPALIDTGAPGCDFAYSGTDCGYNVQTGSAATTVYSELASMFYETLGNPGDYDTSGNPTGAGSFNTGPFVSLKTDDALYWVGTEYYDYPNTPTAWNFYFGSGYQSASWIHGLYRSAWAVHDGDVGTQAAVPIPAAVWLFGSGLLGLIGISRRNKA